MTIYVYCIRCRRRIHQIAPRVWAPTMVGEPELCQGVLDDQPKRCKPGRITNTTERIPGSVYAHEIATL